MNGIGQDIWALIIDRAISIILTDGYSIESAAVIMARPNGLSRRDEDRLIRELRKRFRGTGIE